MEIKTPANLGKIIAKHQVKFIHGRTITDLEDDINHRFDKHVGEYEVKSVTIDPPQGGSRLAMIHYYEQTRITDQRLQSPKVTQTYKDQTVTRKKPGLEGGTQHIAPVTNTPETHNDKPAVSTPDMNTINNALDKMKPEDQAIPKMTEPEVTAVTAKAKTKLPEGFDVDTKPLEADID